MLGGAAVELRRASLLAAARSPAHHAKERAWVVGVNKDVPIAERNSQHRYSKRNDSSSPRLLSLETSGCEPVGAALLLQPSSCEPEDRFCTAGPNIDGPGSMARKSSAAGVAALTFAELVMRLETAMGRASLLLNDRLGTLKHKYCNGHLSRVQETELCDVADRLCTAAYHVQKWAYLLKPKSEQAKKPSKPTQIESTEEAFSAVHFSLPRLIIGAAEAHHGLADVVKVHGTGAEDRVRLLGIPIEDLWAIVPHLERLLLRLGRLSSSLKAESLRDFIPKYFGRAIGSKPARQLLKYLFVHA